MPDPISRLITILREQYPTDLNILAAADIMEGQRDRIVDQVATLKEMHENAFKRMEEVEASLKETAGKPEHPKYETNLQTLVESLRNQVGTLKAYNEALIRDSNQTVLNALLFVKTQLQPKGYEQACSICGLPYMRLMPPPEAEVLEFKPETDAQTE